MNLRLPHPLRTYYYGEQKWDNYLIDLQESVDAKQDATVAELREQNENLRSIKDSIEGGLEELRAQFDWGFTLIADRMDRQTQILRRVTKQLEDIDKTLKSPLVTQAKELFDLGQERLKKGLWEEARECFLNSEAKNRAYFPLQFQLGKLLLLGASTDRQNNVVNETEARKHLLLAMRYAQAEFDTVPEAKRYFGQAAFFAAQAEYLVGLNEQRAGHVEVTRECLNNALSLLSKAFLYWPEFTEIQYLKAKCHALLGQGTHALKEMTDLSDRDRRYASKARADRDFNSFQQDVEGVFRNAQEHPGASAREVITMLSSMAVELEWARRSHPDPSDGSDDLGSIERLIASGTRIVRTLDVDIEGLRSELIQSRRTLYLVPTKAFGRRRLALESEITSLEAQRSSSQYSMQSLAASIKGTRSQGLGCVGGIVAVVAFEAVVPTLLAPWKQQMNSVTGYPAFLLTIAMYGVVGTVGYWLGNEVGSSGKKQPFKDQMRQHATVIDECERRFPPLRDKLKRLDEEIRQFTLFQSHITRGSETAQRDWLRLAARLRNIRRLLDSASP